MTQNKWLNERLAYIRGLKAPNDHLLTLTVAGVAVQI